MKKTLLAFFVLSALAYGQALLSGNGVLATAGSGGVTAHLLVAKDASNPTLYVLPSSGGCGSGVARTSAASAATFILDGIPGEVYSMVAQGVVTAGHIVTGGTTAPGEVLDSGQTSNTAITVGTCTVGKAMISATDGQAVRVQYQPEYGAQLVHVIGVSIPGSGTAGVLQAGDGISAVAAVPALAQGGFACSVEIVGAAISANASGAATVAVYRRNGVIPETTDSTYLISASAPITLSAAQSNSNASTLSGWCGGTCTVAAGDFFVFKVATADGALTSLPLVELFCK